MAFTPTSYFPSSDFAIPRAYLRGIAVVYTLPTVTIVTPGNPIHFRYAEAGYYQDSYITVREDVWEWNSNCYKLSEVFANEETFVLGAGTPTPVTYSCEWVGDGNLGCYYAQVNYFTAPTQYRINLPDPPTPFWIDVPSCPEFLG